MLHRGATPGILGGTSNIGYFHLPLSAGLSGTNTPLAAVAGAQFQHGGRHDQQSYGRDYYHPESLSSLTPSSETASSRPASHEFDRRQSSAAFSVADDQTPGSATHDKVPLREPGPEDIQIVTHVTYAGNVKLSLTAEILLDYPMPSFVNIPLKLTVTGIAFDGVAILAYIKKRAHFCFLGPEDAEALIGAEDALTRVNSSEDNKKNVLPADATAGARAGGAGAATAAPKHGKVGGLLEEIKIESEIGQKENGRQVLKNVGKVEKFILEQVRRIFEDEFVYPSFWTFLV